MRDGDGSVSNWQSAGSRLQAALYTLAKVGSLPSGAAAADGAADTSPAHFALGAYTGLLQGTLDAFSTSIAEDRKALGLTAGGKASAAADGDGMPPRAILATQFRLSQKTLLNQAIAAAVKLGAEGVIDGAAALKFETLGARAYAKAAADPSAIRTPSGLVLQHEVEGTGASPTSADTVEVHYEGKNGERGRLEVGTRACSCSLLASDAHWVTTSLSVLLARSLCLALCLALSRSLSLSLALSRSLDRSLALSRATQPTASCSTHPMLAATQSPSRSLV